MANLRVQSAKAAFLAPLTLFSACETQASPAPSLTPIVQSVALADTAKIDFRAVSRPPSDFVDLERSRVLVMDLFFGTRRLGEVRVSIDGAKVSFLDPVASAALLSDARDPSRVAELLRTGLDTNADKICGRLNDTRCGVVETESAAVIVDEGRLRISLFLGEALLSPRHEARRGFLAVSASNPSLVSSTGLALSGTGAGPLLYNLQNRAILSAGAARIGSNIGVVNGTGMVIDDLVAEWDHRNARFSAGLFWSPTNEFIGDRRILGLGFRNQLDTSLDRERLQGTSEILYLRQPARVELLVNGRLVDSRFYDAGNIAIDTSSLPGGATTYTLRVQEGLLPVREEQRFFVRSTDLAPLGRPLYHLSAGFLAESRSDRQPKLSDQPFMSGGASVRLTKAIGVQGNLLGTPDEQLAQASLLILSSKVRMRASGLVTSRGATSGFIQLTSKFGGAFYVNADVRATEGGRDSLADSFGPATSFDSRSTIPLRASNLIEGNASAGLRLRTLDLQLNGSVRNVEGRRSFAIAPSIRWHLAEAPNLQVTFLVNAGLTGQTTTGFAGLRIVARRGTMSTTATAGTAIGGRQSGASILSYTEYDFRPWENGRLTLNGGIQNEPGNRSISGGALLSSSIGRARADLVHRFGLPFSYSLNAQVNGALRKDTFLIGGQEIAESVLVASVRGGRGTYELLVDGLPRGTIVGGRSLSLFLQPYRAYQVQLRTLGDSAEDFDPAPREVTVYPGNVVRQEWEVSRFVTIFGRLRDTAGRAIIGAKLESGGTAILTEDRGAFQIDAPLGATILISSGKGDRCSIVVPSETTENYLALGDVTCG